METHRKITLPSGATCKIRRLTLRDSIELGMIPDPIKEDSKKSDEPARNQAQAVKMCEIILCECTGRITRKNGESFKVVRKHFDDCSDNEENCDLFSLEEDGNYIVEQVMQLSGFSAAAKEAARPFPKEQESAGNSSPASDQVPQVAQ